ncbi:MAG: hypothetical protein GY862_23500 [Gammaproteobacteria bacterium]|nr:hypothetical protein [Gammaproteobacteria bacterium]
MLQKHFASLLFLFFAWFCASAQAGHGSDHSVAVSVVNAFGTPVTADANVDGSVFAFLPGNTGFLVCGEAGDQCETAYTDGTRVSLTQAEGGGSLFRRWINCPDTGGGCQLLMDRDHQVAAVFVPENLPDLGVMAFGPDSAPANPGDAIVEGGIAVDNAPYAQQADVDAGEIISVLARIFPDPGHAGELTDVVVVAIFTPADGSATQIYSLNANGDALPWNTADIGDLEVFQQVRLNAAGNEIAVYEGVAEEFGNGVVRESGPGGWAIYVAYKTSAGRLRVLSDIMIANHEKIFFWYGLVFQKCRDITIPEHCDALPAGSLGRRSFSRGSCAGLSQPLPDSEWCPAWLSFISPNSGIYDSATVPACMNNVTATCNVLYRSCGSQLPQWAWFCNSWHDYVQN